MDIRITLSGRGGPLDEVVVEDAVEGENQVTDALVKLLAGTLLWDGDTITIREVVPDVDDMSMEAIVSRLGPIMKIEKEG